MFSESCFALEPVGQPAARPDLVEHAEGVDSLQAGVEEFIIEEILVEAFHRERLALTDFRFLARKKHAEAVPEECSGGIFEKADEAGGVDLGGLPGSGCGSRERRLQEPCRALVGCGGGGQTVGLRVAEQGRVATVEVGCVERLERMDGFDVRQYVPRGAGESAGDVIFKFVDYWRRRELAVVADASARIADIEALAGGEDRFEELVPVVVAPGAVSGARFFSEAVETGTPVRSRENSVRHAEQADDVERDAAHRKHRAEGYPPGQEAR